MGLTQRKTKKQQLPQPPQKKIDLKKIDVDAIARQQVAQNKPTGLDAARAVHKALIEKLHPLVAFKPTLIEVEDGDGEMPASVEQKGDICQMLDSMLSSGRFTKDELIFDLVTGLHHLFGKLDEDHNRINTGLCAPVSAARQHLIALKENVDQHLKSF